MTLQLAHGDITGEIAGSVDAIVNAANSSLLGGGGVDGAIHRAAGPSLLAECREIRARQYPDGLPAGSAVATGAGRLPCRWVIHTVGPVHRQRQDQSSTLRSCYRTSLELAVELGASSIAFPLVSAGIYGWPVDDAIRQARAGIEEAGHPELRVCLVLFSPATFELAQRITQEPGADELG
jgi:O-acetyl-ADP-ribose deacetylase (regulator of RNase III)